MVGAQPVRAPRRDVPSLYYNGYNHSAGSTALWTVWSSVARPAHTPTDLTSSRTPIAHRDFLHHRLVWHPRYTRSVHHTYKPSSIWYIRYSLTVQCLTLVRHLPENFKIQIKCTIVYLSSTNIHRKSWILHFLGQDRSTFYLPSSLIYLPRASGQALMSSSGLHTSLEATWYRDKHLYLILYYTHIVTQRWKGIQSLKDNDQADVMTWMSTTECHTGKHPSSTKKNTTPRFIIYNFLPFMFLCSVLQHAIWTAPRQSKAIFVFQYISVSV